MTAKVNRAEDSEGSRLKYKAGDILKDEISIIGEETVEVRRSKYKIYYDSRAAEKIRMNIVLKAISKVLQQSPGTAFLLLPGSIGNYTKKAL